MSERLYSQIVDIFIYDLNNKYQTLKLKGIDKNKVNNYMSDYEKIRIKDFINDVSKVRDIYKK
jgi:hypothetical protein